MSLYLPKKQTYHLKKVIQFICFAYLTLSAWEVVFALDKSLEFPVFKLLKMDSISYLSNNDLPENKNTVFINFSPTCEHCQRTIKSILENIAKFKETQFVLTSFEAFESLQRFYFNYGLSSFTNVYLGQETDYTLTRQLTYSSFPCTVLFNKNKIYLKKIEGETNAKTLLKVLKL